MFIMIYLYIYIYIYIHIFHSHKAYMTCNLNQFCFIQGAHAETELNLTHLQAQSGWMAVKKALQRSAMRPAETRDITKRGTHWR